MFISEDSFYNARKDLTITLLKLQQEFEIHLMLITKIIKTVSDPVLRKQQRDNELTRYNTLLIYKLKEIRTFRNILILYLEKTLQESFN